MSDKHDWDPPYTYKNGVLKIEAFKARIDKSKALEFQQNLAHKYRKSSQSTTSPYFPPKSHMDIGNL